MPQLNSDLITRITRDRSSLDRLGFTPFADVKDPFKNIPLGEALLFVNAPGDEKSPQGIPGFLPLSPALFQQRQESPERDSALAGLLLGSLGNSGRGRGPVLRQLKQAGFSPESLKKGMGIADTFNTGGGAGQGGQR